MALLGGFKRILEQVRGRTPAPTQQVQRAHLGRGLPPESAQQQSMNVIQVPDLSRKLVTRYGLREKSPAPTLATEIQPVVVVDDLVGESDLIRPRIRPCAGAVVAVGAASQSAFSLFNPATSGVILHLQYFLLCGTAAGSWDVYGAGSTSLQVGAGVSGFRNGLFPAQTPAGVVYGAASWVAAGVLYGKLRTPITNIIIVPWDAVIDENQGINLRAQTNHSNTHEFTAVWTEEDKR